MTNKYAWLLRPNPCYVKRIEEFQTQNIIAIGWTAIGEFTGKTKEDIKEILSGEPYNYTGLVLANACVCIGMFVNQMQAGDFVLTPNGDDIYVGVIESDYFFNPDVDALDDGYSHQRKVTWYNKVSRECLSENLRSALRVRRTVTDLSAYSNEIEVLCLA